MESLQRRIEDECLFSRFKESLKEGEEETKQAFSSPRASISYDMPSYSMPSYSTPSWDMDID